MGSTIACAPTTKANETRCFSNCVCRQIISSSYCKSIHIFRMINNHHFFFIISEQLLLLYCVLLLFKKNIVLFIIIVLFNTTQQHSNQINPMATIVGHHPFPLLAVSKRLLGSAKGLFPCYRKVCHHALELWGLRPSSHRPFSFARTLLGSTSR